jgi:hypothetical protein
MRIVRRGAVAFVSASAQGLSPMQTVVSPAEVAEGCYLGCPEDDPHPILAGDRSFVAFGTDLWEVLTPSSGAPIPLRAP